MCFDCTVSVIALILSLAYFGQFHGIREGTFIAAFGVGKILALYDPLKPTVLRFLRGRRRSKRAASRPEGAIPTGPPQLMP